MTASHFFLGAPRALKFETGNPWDIPQIHFFWFFKKNRFMPFYAFFRGVTENRQPFFYLPTKTLAFLHELAQVMPLESCFGIFQKYAFLHP
ncbi:MAG: hypothetical protein GY928_27275 [Colwellia sp.]|nr:hypothetical protein [Colwellia sp.]